MSKITELNIKKGDVVVWKTDARNNVYVVPENVKGFIATVNRESPHWSKINGGLVEIDAKPCDLIITPDQIGKQIGSFIPLMILLIEEDGGYEWKLYDKKNHKMLPFAMPSDNGYVKVSRLPKYMADAIVENYERI